MIDIHCHILPKFDDGSADLSESLSMAQIASASGVTEIIATPHFRGEEAEMAKLSKLVRRYERLSAAIRRVGIPLKLHPGAEILCLPQTLRLARDQMLPTLGDSNYLLVEFIFDETPEYMNDMLKNLTGCGYRVIVAHPERYDAVQKDPALSATWFRAGYAMQVNKGSLLGSFGASVQQTAARMLQAGQVAIIASDAHSIARRNTDMRPLRQWLSKEYDEKTIQLLLEENPRRVLEGKDLEHIPPRKEFA